jgi:hypothetical protein
MMIERILFVHILSLLYFQQPTTKPFIPKQVGVGKNNRCTSLIVLVLKNGLIILEAI